MNHGSEYSRRRSGGHTAPTGAESANRLTPSERRLIQWGKREAKRGKEQGIILEGSKLISEALDAGHPIEAVWFTTEYGDSEGNLIDRLRQNAHVTRQITAREMRGISAMETPPGIVAVAPEPHLISRQPGDAISLIVVLAQVQDPGNLGGVIRTADFFGADEIWLGPRSADPYNPKVIRGGMGAVFRIPVLRIADLNIRIEAFKRKGASVWAAVAHGSDTEIQIGRSGARILLIGGESHGLEEDMLRLADHKVFIPGARRGESLNLSVAAGILIYNATTGRFNQSK